MCCVAASLLLRIKHSLFVSHKATVGLLAEDKREICYIHAGVQLDIAPHSSAEHSINPCFLAPGIYSLYAYDVHQLSSQSSAQPCREAVASPGAGTGTVIAVSPAYFIVE